MRGKDTSVLAVFAGRLLRHSGQLEASQHVAIDLSVAKTKGVSYNFGNARVVYYKYRVMQNVVVACHQGSEVREPHRRSKAGPVGADTMDVAQEPGELNGERNPEVGVYCPGAMCDG
jgi:hypothetical protein